MTDLIASRKAANARTARGRTGMRRHHEPDNATSDAPESSVEKPVPRFGLSYVVSAAARFDSPHEALGRFLTDDLAGVDDVETLLSQVRLVETGVEPEAVRRSNGFRCTIQDGHAAIEERDGDSFLEACDPIPIDAFATVLLQWLAHLGEVPLQLDRVSAEAAAAQRRVATLSWLESGVAMAAGNGWSHEAGQLDRISRAISDGTREQIGAMRDAGESWTNMREELCRGRGHDSQLDAIVSALDQLLGSS